MAGATGASASASANGQLLASASAVTLVKSASVADPFVGTAAIPGAAITSSTGANTPRVETVLADGAGADDSMRDGVFSAAGSYTVPAATLAVTKTSRVIRGPINNTANPKAIPGATIDIAW